MPDIATIATFLNSVKTATDIAKAIKDLDATVAKAELKLKVADLLTNLADVKISAAELQELLQEKQKEIDRLIEALAIKSKVVKSGDAYFVQDADGKLSHDPFCVHCWEIKKLLNHLVQFDSRHMVCPNCANKYVQIYINYPKRA